MLFEEAGGRRPREQGGPGNGSGWKDITVHSGDRGGGGRGGRGARPAGRKRHRVSINHITVNLYGASTVAPFLATPPAFFYCTASGVWWYLAIVDAVLAALAAAALYLARRAGNSGAVFVVTASSSSSTNHHCCSRRPFAGLISIRWVLVAAAAAGALALSVLWFVCEPLYFAAYLIAPATFLVCCNCCCYAGFSARRRWLERRSRRVAPLQTIRSEASSGPTTQMYSSNSV